MAEEVSRDDDCGSAREPRWQPPDDRSLAMILGASIRWQEGLMATRGKAPFQERQIRECEKRQTEMEDGALEVDQPVAVLQWVNKQRRLFNSAQSLIAGIELRL